MGKSKRFRMMYDYLYKIGKIHKKSQLAEMIGCSRSVVSNAYNGKDDFVTPSIVQKICDTFPGIFNYEWLMEGEGNMLQAQHLPQEPIKDVQPTSAPTEMEKWLMRQNEELVALLKEAQATIKEKDQQIINLSQNMRQDVPIIAANFLAESSPKPYEEQKKF